MNLNSIKKKIEIAVASEKRWPIIVDFSNRSDLSDFVEYFNVGENKFLAAELFCGKDGTFKLEELVNTIENNNSTTFVVGLTAFLKLQGENYTKNILKSLLSKNTNGHLIILTYQCRNYLKFTDTRFVERNQLLFADGDFDIVPEVCFISPSLIDAFPHCYIGFEKIGNAMEQSSSQTIYLATDITRHSFEKSIFNISQMNNGYDILCNKDARTKTLPSNFGSETQWNEALKEMGNGDWTTVAKKHFGSILNLSDYVSNYSKLSDYKKWLYFVTLSLFGTKNKPYLQHAVFNSANYSEFIKSLYRTILTIQHTDPEFNQLYAERKEMLKSFANGLDEIVDFCKVLSVKQENAIYYLTDLSQPEREKIIDWLDTYGSKYTATELAKILNTVYPDLSCYLSVYRFKNALLDSYFECYKYQKVINKILPSFEQVVDEQSHELGFVNALKPRSALIDKLDMNMSHAYFFDALGVEYLGFIQQKCNQYGLSVSISCGRSELPSLTCFNKEFVPTFQDKGCDLSDIKALDEIKHHGEDNYDYQKDKKPVYLIKELEIIDDLLKKIKANLFAGQYKKAIIVSDHGASRLAVLHETENIWKMATRGVHSGRCCPQNEIDSKPDFAISQEGFWILPNYDRFQGGRKANVEVHGGASLEEVAVPIIEITKMKEKIEAFITDDSKVVTLSAKEYPIIKIYVGVISNNISIKLNGSFYNANKTTEDYLYMVELPDCTKKGIYTCDIIDGADTLSSNETFEVKKKGMSETSLFD